MRTKQSHEYTGEIEWNANERAFCSSELEPAIRLGIKTRHVLSQLAEQLGIDAGLDEFLEDSAETIVKCTDHDAIRDYHSRDVFVTAITRNADDLARSVEYWINQFCGPAND